ncbi:MAG TPA: class I SAM-dependent methyltransferase [Pseudonocardiaceae bacterium]|jgi:SAM-dependent methyltransferase|nr:class I SAM-dependent methyltransferase [Pseudonocardiaceae bacterium]
MTGQYGPLWEAFWTDLPKRTGEAFWDCAPSVGAATHVELFAPFIDRTLPFVDVGCGTGTQTAYFGGLFDRVIGVDIADAALAFAGRHNARDNVEYRKLDVLDLDEVTAFHERFGDVNVYLSGVIHQLSPADRLACARALATLAGAGGCVFDQELTPASYQYMQELIADAGDQLPKLDRVSLYFRIGLQPAAGEAELESIFAAADFDVIQAGDLMLRTTETMADGTGLDLPTRYVVARPKTVAPTAA